MNTSKKLPEQIKPEWIRIPQASSLFGVGRTKLYELIGAGRIKTVSMRERGQTRGTRLISYDSLAAFLESQASGGFDEVGQD